jgi:hypothetical protein
MAAIALTSRASSIALPGVPAELPARPPIDLDFRAWWVRVTYWPLELVRLVALIYLLPLVIYVVVSPLAVVIAAAYFLLGGSANGF